MVGQREFMDVHDAWLRGKSISEIARATGATARPSADLLRQGATPSRKPLQISSKLDQFREYLLARTVGEDPVSNAEVLRDEIRELGTAAAAACGARLFVRGFGTARLWAIGVVTAKLTAILSDIGNR